MRKALFSICMLLVSLSLSGQGIPLCKETPFQAGETVEMGVMFKWGAVNTEVGRARLTLETVPYGPDSTLVGHAHCGIKSAPFFDVFFKMRENFQTWFTLDELRPLEAIRDTYENGYSATNHYIYDWEAGFIRADVSFYGDAPKHYDLPVQGMSNDIVSLIYSLRAVDWTSCREGEPVEVPFAIDDSIFQVKVTYQGREDFKVRRIGWCRALRFSCSVVAGALFAGDQQLQVWFSDDANHLPLAVMAPLKVGNMWAWLKSWDGLKAPFEARY